MIEINGRLSIPDSELRFTASRGGGPGGQHVNKVASRVTLHFDVGASPSLDERQRERLMQKLAGRINNDGVLQITTHASRSQAANRELLVERFRELLANGLRVQRRRRATRPTAGARARAREAKQRRAGLKRARGKVRDPDRD